MENVLDKAGTLAEEKLKVIKAPAEAKAAEEAKAASDKAQEAEKQEKAKEVEKIAELEAKAKEDERILATDDKTLSEPEAKRKAELQETAKKKAESPDEKIKRVQEATQKRIDEIKSEQLAKENKTAERMAALEAELEELKKPKIQENAAAIAKREEQERITKYVEEDKSKPNEQRREMSKESLETWYLEDPLAATEWIQERTHRRNEERKAIETKKLEEKTKETGKTLAEDFIRKQNEAKARLFAKYPGVNPSKEKLATFSGKTNSEIREALSKENEEFRLCSDIVAEDPKKYLESENGPDLVIAEMEKRLKKPEEVKKKVELTEDEIEARIQAEVERRALLNGEGASSSTKGKKVEQNNQTKSELRQKQEIIAKKAGMTVEQLDNANARRQKIPGASSFTMEGEE